MSDESDIITTIEAPIYLKYNFTAGAAPTRFLTQLKKRQVDWAEPPGTRRSCVCAAAGDRILRRGYPRR